VDTQGALRRKHMLIFEIDDTSLLLTGKGADVVLEAASGESSGYHPDG